MSENLKQFNLPSYINIPFFLYQDKRLEKAATLMAAFFYSLYTAGKSIKASREYLCELTGIGKTQYYSTLNLLEECKYIRRTGNTNSSKIEWIYCPNYSIEVDESETLDKKERKKTSQTSSVDRTKLVRRTELNLSGRPNTYNKEDNKEDIFIERETKNPIAPVEYKETLYQDLNPLTAQFNITKEQAATFDYFWSIYPRKQNLIGCKTSWFSRGCHLIFDEIYEALSKQVKEDSRFLEGYAPSPFNYINKEGWKDAIYKKSPKTKSKTKYRTMEQILGGFTAEDLEKLK